MQGLSRVCAGLERSSGLPQEGVAALARSSSDPSPPPSPSRELPLLQAASLPLQPQLSPPATRVVQPCLQAAVVLCNCPIGQEPLPVGRVPLVSPWTGISFDARAIARWLQVKPCDPLAPQKRLEQGQLLGNANLHAVLQWWHEEVAQAGAVANASLELAGR